MNRNILIVEDDPAMRVVIRQTLDRSKLDYDEIFEAENGREGLKMLDEHKIDLLLVDIYMPVMDGMEMLDHVRDHPVHHDIPVVIISTENDEKRIDAIVRSGMGFVHKPFTRDLLEDQIVKLTGVTK